jgi:hypothetical protein
MCGGYTEAELMGGMWQPNYMYRGSILSFEEMMGVVDRYTKTDAGGYQYVSVVKIRDDLQYNWALDELQIRTVISEMRNARLLTGE